MFDYIDLFDFVFWAILKNISLTGERPTLWREETQLWPGQIHKQLQVDARASHVRP